MAVFTVITSGALALVWDVFCIMFDDIDSYAEVRTLLAARVGPIQYQAGGCNVADQYIAAY